MNILLKTIGISVRVKAEASEQGRDTVFTSEEL